MLTFFSPGKRWFWKMEGDCWILFFSSGEVFESPRCSFDLLYKIWWFEWSHEDEILPLFLVSRDVEPSTLFGLMKQATFWESKEVIADNIETYLRSLGRMMEPGDDMFVQQTWFQWREPGTFHWGHVCLIMSAYLNSWIKIAWTGNINKFPCNHNENGRCSNCCVRFWEGIGRLLSC